MNYYNNNWAQQIADDIWKGGTTAMFKIGEIAAKAIINHVQTKRQEALQEKLQQIQELEEQARLYGDKDSYEMARYQYKLKGYDSAIYWLEEAIRKSPKNLQTSEEFLQMFIDK